MTVSMGHVQDHLITYATVPLVGRVRSVVQTVAVTITAHVTRESVCVTVVNTGLQASTVNSVNQDHTETPPQNQVRAVPF